MKPYLFFILVFLLAFAVTPVLAFSPSFDDVVSVDNTNFQYSGTWYHDAISCADCYLSTYSYSNVSSATASYTFIGSAFSIYSRLDNNRGIAFVYVDGVYHGSFSGYASSAISNSLVYSVVGLSNASHVVGIVVSGQKQVSSSGYYVVIDRFTYVIPSPTNTPVISTATSTFTPVPTSTIVSTLTLVPTSTIVSTFTPVSTSTIVPTFTFVPTVTNTPIPGSTPVPSSDDLRPFILGLPILFVDWQLSIIWVLSLLNDRYYQYLLLLDFKGFEIFVLFLVVGISRRFIFPRS